MITFLKIAVVVMGILIVAGVVLLAIMMYGKLNNSEDSVQVIQPEIPINIETQQPSETIRSIELPSGSKVESIASEEGRVILLINNDKGEQRLLFIDIESSNVIKNLPIHGG